MVDDIDRRLQKLKEAEEVIPTTIRAKKPVETLKIDDLDKRVRKKLKEHGIVEIFEKDGKLVISSAFESDKWFIISLCTNAILIVLLITKVIGAW